LIKFILIVLCSFSCFAQLKTVTFKQIDSVTLHKPVVIFLNTDWCRNCISMKKKTFADPELIRELNANYNFISFNAESKEDIFFKGKQYKYHQINKRKGIHELAQELGKHKHRISYPTLVFLDKKKEVVFKSTSKLKAKEFLNLLNELKKHDKI